jgi:hypothetical protein
MLNFRNKAIRVAALATTAVALVLALIGPSVGDATTGAHPLANPPRYHVSRAEARPYIGRFALGAPHSRSLRTAAYVARFNQFGYLAGSLVVYAFNRNGQTTSWVGTTYEYHPRGNGRMTIDVISPNNQVIFAKMKLQVGRGGRLSGKLFQLIPPGPTQQITLKPLKP